MRPVDVTLDGLRLVPLSIRQKCALELLESAAQLRQRWLAFEDDSRVASAVDVLAQQEHVCLLLARLLTEGLEQG